MKRLFTSPIDKYLGLNAKHRWQQYALEYRKDDFIDVHKDGKHSIVVCLANGLSGSEGGALRIYGKDGVVVNLSLEQTQAVLLAGDTKHEVLQVASSAVASRMSLVLRPIYDR